MGKDVWIDPTNTEKTSAGAFFRAPASLKDVLIQGPHHSLFFKLECARSARISGDPTHLDAIAADNWILWQLLMKSMQHFKLRFLAASKKQSQDCTFDPADLHSNITSMHRGNTKTAMKTQQQARARPAQAARIPQRISPPQPSRVSHEPHCCRRHVSAQLCSAFAHV